MKSTFSLPVSLLCLSMLQACESDSSFFGKEKIAQLEPISTISVTDPISAPKAEEEKTLCADPSDTSLICNPLGGDDDPAGDYEAPDTTKNKLGLIASIYEGDKSFVNLDKYITSGIKHPVDLYFSNFNVPTRSFDQGFGSDDAFLKSVKDEKLIEWFSIHARGFLLLPQAEESGFFHVVTQSDDGIRIKVGGEVILENDNTHAPTIDCASKVIELKKGEKKAFELQYFQGPRYHIALVTMIKRIEDPTVFMKSGNCKTKNVHSVMEAEGYKVIGPSWFVLPDGY